MWRRTSGSLPRSTLRRFQSRFGGLILAQAAHSLEEYVGRLWETFAPARLVSRLISDNLELGFLIANFFLVGFGLWCWIVPVRRGWAGAVPLAWVWVTIELINGIGHPLWSFRQGHYTPGTLTAPLLLVLAIYLARQLRRPEVQHNAPPQR